MSEIKNMHVDAILTNLAIKYRNSGYVAGEIFPVVPVQKRSDEFYVFEKPERFTPVDTRISPRSEANEVEWNASTDNYSVKDYGLKEAVSHEQEKNADTPLRPRSTTTEFLTDLILLDREIRVKNLLENKLSSTTVTNKWDAEGGKPLEDLKAAINQCFIKPNVIIIPEKVWNVLKDHSTVLERVKYGGMVKAATEVISNILEVPKILVPTCKYNTAARGRNKAAVYDGVWGDNIYMGYVTGSPALNQVSLGYVFAKTEHAANNAPWVTRVWDDPARGKGGSTMIQVETSTDERIVCSDVGYALKDCLS